MLNTHTHTTQQVHTLHSKFTHYTASSHTTQQVHTLNRTYSPLGAYPMISAARRAGSGHMRLGSPVCSTHFRKWALVSINLNIK